MLPKLYVGVLSWNRCKLLEETILSFYSVNKMFFDKGMVNVTVLDQGSKDDSMKYLYHFKEQGLIHEIVMRPKNYGVGGGSSILMYYIFGKINEAKSTFKVEPFILYLQNDFPSKYGGWLHRCAKFLNLRKDVGFIRMSDKKFSETNVITNEQYNWVEDLQIYGSRFKLCNNMHLTLHPIMMRLWVAEYIFPFKNEREAQEKFYKLNLRGAQIIPPAFKDTKNYNKQHQSQHGEKWKM